MAFVEVLTGNGVTVQQWDNQLFAEYLAQLWWKNWMGTSSSSAIQVKQNLMKQSGDALTIQTRGLLVGGKVVGNADGIGNEGLVEFFNHKIKVDNVRHLVRIDDIPMSQQRTNFDVLQASREALSEGAALDLDKEITLQLSDVTVGRVQGRYLYGSVDSNFDSTHATALNTIDNANDQLSVNMLGIAKRKAQIPTNALAAVRPIRIKNGKNFEEWFMSVHHPFSIRDLVNNDSAWRNAQLNIPPQSNSQSPIYTGSSFKGAWNGVLIYEYERLDLITSSTINTAHGFLLGAQAAAVVWAQRSKFGEEFADLGHRVSYEQHEIRGVAKLAYNRSTKEDNGVIHVFSAAVSD